MKLYINTSSNKKTVIGLDYDVVEKSSELWHSQVVIPLIQELVKKHQKEIHDITEIEVVVGPGSFTGLRVGVAIANALGYALQVPVNGQKITEGFFIEPRYEG